MPAIPARRHDNTVPLAALMLPLGRGHGRAACTRSPAGAGATRSTPAGPPTRPTARRSLPPPGSPPRPVVARARLPDGRPGDHRVRAAQGHRTVAGRRAAARAHRQRHRRARGSPATPPGTCWPSAATATTSSSPRARSSTRPRRPTWPSCARCSTAATRSCSTATTRTSPTAWRAAAGRDPAVDRVVGVVEAVAAERRRRRVRRRACRSRSC